MSTTTQALLLQVSAGSENANNETFIDEALDYLKRQGKQYKQATHTDHGRLYVLDPSTLAALQCRSSDQGTVLAFRQFMV